MPRCFVDYFKLENSSSDSVIMGRRDASKSQLGFRLLPSRCCSDLWLNYGNPSDISPNWEIHPGIHLLGVYFLESYRMELTTRRDWGMKGEFLWMTWYIKIRNFKKFEESIIIIFWKFVLGFTNSKYTFWKNTYRMKLTIRGNWKMKREFLWMTWHIKIRNIFKDYDNFLEKLGNSPWNSGYTFWKIIEWN